MLWPNSQTFEWLQQEDPKPHDEVHEWLDEVNEKRPVDISEQKVSDRPALSVVDEADEYVQVGCKQLVGIYISVWMRESLWSHTNHVEVLSIGCGALGFLGNKGAVCLRLQLYHTSICFVCSHLSSGESKGTERRRDAEVADILNRAVFSDIDTSDWTATESFIGAMPNTVVGHDVSIWLGDLNYRINLDNEVIHDAIQRMDWEYLFAAEQLKVQKEAGLVFEGWHEGTIDFPPTYRFRINQNTYCGDGTGPEVISMHLSV